MQLIIPNTIQIRFTEALIRAKDQEIGGILMGEDMGGDIFRVCDISIQHHSGSFARFMRVVHDFVTPLSRFFQRTNHHYTRFNYLGEWHSHPSFAMVPSATDRATMHDLVADSAVGARFAVLLIIRLSALHVIEGGVTVFQPNGHEFEGQLVLEHASL